MKKFLAILMVLVLCLCAFVACNDDETPDGDTPEVTYDVNAAASYVFNLYKDKATTVTADFEVTSKVMINNVLYTVEWTSTEGTTITKKNENVYTIDVNETTENEYTFTLTATVKAADGTTATKTFTYTVPAYKLNTFEEYINAAEGDSLTIQGIVVGINSKAAGNKYNHLFLADPNVTGGYYCYKLDKDPVADYSIEVGMLVEVTGTAAPYSGMMEIKDGSAKIISSEKQTVTPVDLTEKFAAGESLKNYVGLPVTIKGVEIGNQDLATETSQYLYFKLNGKSAYIRTYVTDFPLTLKAEDKATIDAAHAAKYGWNANVTGILVLYNSNPYLIPMTTDCFEYLEKIEKTPAQKIEDTIANLGLPTTIDKDTVITLPAAGANYADVTLTWALTENAAATLADGKLTVTLQDEATELTLTLTLTCGETTETKTITVKVDAATTDLYVPKDVETPAKDTAYKFYLAQNNRGEILYFAGAMSGNYLATTTKADAATDVYLEEVEGGFKLYFMDGETKTYIDAHEYQTGKAGIRLTAEPTCVWVFNAELGVLTTTIAEKIWYLGTYNNFNTMSLSETWRISGDNAANVGVSQFPAHLATLAPAVKVPVDVETPAKDTAYKFYLAQNNRGEILYFAGAMSGNYLATTTKIDKAVDVYLEEVEGGFKLYFMDGETKTYIDAHEYQTGKAGIRLTAEPTCVWVFNAELGVLTTTIAEKIWYLGTYNNFNTMSLSETWRISGDNAANVGVSQFPAYLATTELKEVAPIDVETPVKDTAYKFYLAQNNRGEILYFAGAMSGNYLATTNRISKAVDVYLEEVEGGFKLYFMDGETKTYIDAHEYQTGKAGIRLTAEPTCVWVFNAELGVLTTTIAEKIWYLGTYNNFNTMSLSETWRISGDNAANVGVSQFPAALCVIGFAEDETPDEGGNEGGEEGGEVTPPAGGEDDDTGDDNTAGGGETDTVATKITLSAIGSDGTTVYYVSELKSDKTFGVTTNAAEAMELYLVATATEGEYNLYYLDGDTKMYLYMGSDSTKTTQASTDASVDGAIWKPNADTQQILNGSYSRAFALYNDSSVRTYATTSQNTYIWVWYSAVA